jgi:hypothetical protein
MESQHYFKVYYAQEFVWSVVAHTKWEAIDKAYYKFIGDGMELDRKNMRAKKLY